MHRTFHLMVAAIAAIVLTHFAAGAGMAQDATKQIKLTEKQVLGFIAAYKTMSGPASRTMQTQKSTTRRLRPSPSSTALRIWANTTMSQPTS